MEQCMKKRGQLKARALSLAEVAGDLGKCIGGMMENYTIRPSPGFQVSENCHSGDGNQVDFTIAWATGKLFHKEITSPKDQ
jgi:hypothetical protein